MASADVSSYVKATFTNVKERRLGVLTPERMGPESDLAWSSASVYGVCRPSPCVDLTFGIRRPHKLSVVNWYQPYSHLRATSSQPLLTTWSRSATSDHASQRSVHAPQPRPACTDQPMLGNSSVRLCHQPMAGSADSFSRRQSLEQLTAIERQAQP